MSVFPQVPYSISVFLIITATLIIVIVDMVHNPSDVHQFQDYVSSGK